jgi:hypothetical protein
VGHDEWVGLVRASRNTAEALARWREALAREDAWQKAARERANAQRGGAR